jgi:proline dehydrogenase
VTCVGDTFETSAAAALRRLALDEQAKGLVLSDPRLRAVALRIARRYIGGESREEAFAVVRRINSLGDAATVDYMGESARERERALAAADEFVALAAVIGGSALDCSLSLDLSHIGLVIDGSFCLENARRIATAAAEVGTEVMISMEGYDRVDTILDLHAALAQDHENVGITLQARLDRTAADLEAALERPGRIRLVKGAYEIPADVALAREDERLGGRYIELARRLVDSGHLCSIATHDAQLLEQVASCVAPGHASPLEFEVLLGLGDDAISALRQQGYRTRQYIVYGEEWFLYVCNRIAEEPSRLYQAIVDAVA